MKELRGDRADAINKIKWGSIEALGYSTDRSQKSIKWYMLQERTQIKHRFQQMTGKKQPISFIKRYMKFVAVFPGKNRNKIMNFKEDMFA